MRGAYTLQSTWDGKHQLKHMNLRHINIVSHKVTGTPHYCTLFKTERWEVPNMRCQFREHWEVLFFFFFIFLKITTEKKRKNQPKTFRQHATWCSPFDMVILWSEWVGLGRELRVIKVTEKGMFIVAFVLVRCLGIGEGKTKHCSVMGLLLHASPFPKGPQIAMVLSKVKRKTRKINNAFK